MSVISTEPVSSIPSKLRKGEQKVRPFELQFEGQKKKAQHVYWNDRHIFFSQVVERVLGSVSQIVVMLNCEQKETVRSSWLTCLLAKLQEQDGLFETLVNWVKQHMTHKVSVCLLLIFAKNVQADLQMLVDISGFYWHGQNGVNLEQSDTRHESCGH